MIRPFTLVTLLLAAGSGAYLFAVKHHAQMLDDQIAGLSQGAQLDAQRIRVLQAQWALEIDPTRLQQLAAQFTTLQPMQPPQLTTLAALRASLPPPGSVPPDNNPELPSQAQPSMAQPELDAAAQPDAANPQGLPLPPPPAPVRLASAGPAPRSISPRPARRASHSMLANAAFAASLPPPRRYAAAQPFTPGPAAPIEPAGRNLPMGAEIMSVKATATLPQYAPMPPVTPDNSGSALGLAANLPPPQPLPQNGLNN
jgi:hypothetical protein